MDDLEQIMDFLKLSIILNDPTQPPKSRIDALDLQMRILNEIQHDTNSMARIHAILIKIHRMDSATISQIQKNAQTVQPSQIVQAPHNTGMIRKFVNPYTMPTHPPVSHMAHMSSMVQMPQMPQMPQMKHIHHTRHMPNMPNMHNMPNMSNMHNMPPTAQVVQPMSSISQPKPIFQQPVPELQNYFMVMVCDSNQKAHCDVLPVWDAYSQNVKPSGSINEYVTLRMYDAAQKKDLTDMLVKKLGLDQPNTPTVYRVDLSMEKPRIIKMMTPITMQNLNEFAKFY